MQVGAADFQYCQRDCYHIKVSTPKWFRYDSSVELLCPLLPLPLPALLLQLALNVVS